MDLPVAEHMDSAVHMDLQAVRHMDSVTDRRMGYTDLTLLLPRLSFYITKRPT
jgi:hypothetical protein